MTQDQNIHPQKEFDSIVQTALKAYALYQKHDTLLKERLEERLLHDLVTDLDSLGVLVPGAEKAREVAKAATATQEAVLTKGYELLSAVRTNISRRNSSKDIRKAYGVGQRLSPKIVKDVRKGLSQIAERAEQSPEEARSLGLVAKDITMLKEAIQKIDEVDKLQGQARAEAPNTTKERNRTARRVLEATNAIIGAGVLEFAQNATERATFEALIGAGNPAPKNPEERAARKAERENKKAAKAK